MSAGYAYVKYRRDNLKKVVPVSFIGSENFDLKSFSPSRQYWVFWSNDPKETPASYLEKHSGPIPKIENDADIAVDTGYFRATISITTGKIAESLFK